MKIATKLTQEQAQKLAFIQEKTKQSTDEILLSALEYYYQQLLNTSENHLKKFSQLDFIGCIEAEPNLAENCESILIKSNS
ncbi:MULTISPECIES: hypothetical protein [Okeania]|uniref:CopG family transcriptional regulator n=1 Tax=Okeania hirsuta TaxID=1458930 RepID=A0A3N6PX27_9CYAN|nr:MULTISPECIES: hypothetical protein [Okeania]NES90931.1 hypothetical protein [Okeania sp. SIO2B9]RQH46196.1 hypothetical protein D5R40_09890 [Okeania hirsuta]